MWLGQEHIHESDAISSKTIKEEENQIWTPIIWLQKI